MSEQVIGEPEGVTLADVIRRGDILHPGKMNMARWNVWRSKDGRRPTKARDGRGVPKEMEGRIFQEVMGMLSDPAIAKGVEERQRLAAAAGGAQLKSWQEDGE